MSSQPKHDQETGVGGNALGLRAMGIDLKDRREALGAMVQQLPHLQRDGFRVWRFLLLELRQHLYSSCRWSSCAGCDD